jgi:16S rRNA (cytidine1402-2'-O)-methyltransferase
MSEKGLLYLLPNLLSEEASLTSLPEELKVIIPKLKGFFVENEKEGRRFLGQFLEKGRLPSLPLKPLNEHTKREEYFSLLQPLLNGESWGLISDAGLPCIADPGAEFVFMAKKEGIAVKALSGPSSPILALLLSGLPGQRFAFNGYLPRDKDELEEQIKLLERRSQLEKSTQIWIETPYRVKKMLEMLLKTLKDETLLCVAKNLTGTDEEVLTHTVNDWKKMSLKDDEDHLAIFLIYNEERYGAKDSCKR